MSVVIGIDVGGSTTKIVGFENTIGGKRLIDPIFVRATDPITALYGAFGKFTDQNGIELSDIEIIKVTGVGSAKINKPIYGLECKHESEFECIGRGGLLSLRARRGDRRQPRNRNGADTREARRQDRIPRRHRRRRRHPRRTLEEDARYGRRSRTYSRSPTPATSTRSTGASATSRRRTSSPARRTR